MAPACWVACGSRSNVQSGTRDSGNTSVVSRWATLLCHSKLGDMSPQALQEGFTSNELHIHRRDTRVGLDSRHQPCFMFGPCIWAFLSGECARGLPLPVTVLAPVQSLSSCRHGRTSPMWAGDRRWVGRSGKCYSSSSSSTSSASEQHGMGSSTSQVNGGCAFRGASHNL